MTQNEEKKQYKFFQTPKVLKKLDPSEWVLFTVLFDEWQMMKNEEGWFFRSEDVLSEDTGLSSATIYRKTKSLEEKGFILVKRHSDGKTKSKKYKSNDYKINIETVISLAPIESHQNENESHQIDEPTNNIPSNNIITKENNKIYNINIKTSDDIIPDEVTLHENNKIKNINIKASEDITPDEVTLQDDEVENVFLNNSDDDWLNYEVKRSMTDDVNNDLKLNDMKKENEMSNKVAIEMNAISEQSERQARENESSGCEKENEMTTSTLGDENNTSKEFQNILVDKSKVINNDCNAQGVNPNAKDCAPAPASQTQTQNKATGEPQTSEVEQLTAEEKTKRQKARKEEIRLFNAGHDKHRYDMCHNVKTSADFYRFNALLQADIDYVNDSDWNEDRKKLWHKNYDYWRSKCGTIVMKHLNKVMEMENAS